MFGFRKLREDQADLKRRLDDQADLIGKSEFGRLTLQGHVAALIAAVGLLIACLGETDKEALLSALKSNLGKGGIGGPEGLDDAEKKILQGAYSGVLMVLINVLEAETK
jgi:hypothetical protein